MSNPGYAWLLGAVTTVTLVPLVWRWLELPNLSQNRHNDRGSDGGAGTLAR